MLNIVLKNMKWTKGFDLNVRVEKLGFKALFEGRVGRIGLVSRAYPGESGPPPKKFDMEVDEHG